MHSRNQSLDILRCIAILLVLGHHFIHYHHWAKVGWIGVDLFFVLSGFLISGLLFSEYKRNGQIDIQRFILRRGLKIWPAYYVLVIVTAIISMLVAHARGVPFPSHEVAVSAIFVRNFFGNDGFNYLAHSWSLAVEEHFYLMLPLLLLVLLRLRRLGDPFRSIPWIFLAIAPNLPHAAIPRTANTLPVGNTFENRCAFCRRVHWIPLSLLPPLVR